MENGAVVRRGAHRLKGSGARFRRSLMLQFRGSMRPPMLSSWPIAIDPTVIVDKTLANAAQGQATLLIGFSRQSVFSFVNYDRLVVKSNIWFPRKPPIAAKNLLS
jgi:hypothetical protein